MKSNKLCECGCGQYTLLISRTNTRLGYKKGEPNRFVRGHHGRHNGKQPWFKPVCPRCQEKNSNDRVNCLYCGAALVLNVKSKNKKRNAGAYGDPLVVPSEDLRKLLQPLVDLNSINWLAEQCGSTMTRMKQSLYEQEFISLGVVDRWLTNLGIYHALQDGSIRLCANPSWTRATFENFFLRCGDTPPDDVISNWQD